MLNLLTLSLLDQRYQKPRFCCAIVLYLLVLIIGSIPGARADVGHYASGVVLHSTGYSVLTFLLFSSINGSLNQKAIRSFLMIMCMGALDEVVQSFFPYRHGAVSDWLVDCAAAALTALLLWTCWPKAHRVSASR